MRTTQPIRTEMPALTLRADVQTSSVNVEARTVEVVFSTGAPVTRFDWMSGQRYIETLSLKPAAVRLDRLNNGAPFLNAHNAWDLGDVIGVIESNSARIEKGQGVATVRFSKRADVEPIWQDVRDGIVRNVSVGYRVYKYVQSEGDKGQLPTRDAVDWEPFEISAVPIGADAMAQMRSEDKAKVPTYPCVITTRETTVMNECQFCHRELPDHADDCQTRNAGAPEPTDADRAITQERERAQGILAACRAARLPQSFADKLIADGVALSDARGLVLDSLSKAPEHTAGPKDGPSGVRIGADPLENVWRGISGALLHRINPVAFKLDDNARQYRPHSLIRAMEECLEQRGVRVRGMSNSEIVKTSLEYRSGLHGTSDFANIFADVSNKSLRAAYQAAAQTWGPITRRVGVRDFKPINRVQLGEAPGLEQVLEHGEFTKGTIAEGKEQYQLLTYGRIFGMTRQGLINDDLDAFGRLVTMFAQSAANKESDLAWAQILANGAMGDTIALFHASHGNLAGSAAAIGITTLGDGRAAMRKQKGLDAKTFLNISARFLIVAPEKETVADQYTMQITPAQGSNVNPFSNRLQVISEPRLGGGIVLGDTTISGSATAWYLAASLDQAIDILEYAYLDGEEGPQVETRAGFEIDGVQTKCRLDCAFKVLDFRGLYKNDGV
jgi:hypothetical protein